MAEETTQTEETGMAALETLAESTVVETAAPAEPKLTSMAAHMQQAAVKTLLPVYG